MARKLKTDLWKKAYLIEFMSKDGKEVEDSFTFSVPPESEEITYSQRKSETKTFGGLHVDDYGMDAAKIVLSGSTINRDLKRIYHPEKQIEWKSGEEEIYLLRDLLKKYKTAGNAERKIFLYDLSKTRYGRGTNIKNYWRVFPGDFKIRRSSDRPFAYKYTIEFTAVDIENGCRKQEYGLEYVEKAVKGIQDAAGWIREKLSFIDTFTGWIEKGQIYAESINVILEEIDSNIRDITNIFDTLSNAFLGYADILDNIIGNAGSILSIPKDASQKYMNIGLEFMNAGKRLLKSTENLFDTAMAMFDKESPYWEDMKAQADLYGMTAEEYHDIWFDLLTDMENEASAVAAASKDNNLPDITPGGTGPETGKPLYIPTYGYEEVTLNSTDTFESLAAQYLGSPGMAVIIAAYNGAASMDELNPGDTIKIPILTPPSRSSSNRIYSPPDERDNYGRDIYLNNDGCTAASTSGDYQLTGGTDNLNQAILLRLRESVNKSIRLNAYGIRTNISDPAAGVAYIISSIDLTVNMEPRVSAVENISFAGAGDGLNVTVEYTDINRNGGNVSGRV
ncbi:MAG: hypothetical protein LBQ88_17345 [Treponema sp.]|jgi:hypothetical protein|nr:hypothetical protein [Treponema sp.]